MDSTSPDDLTPRELNIMRRITNGQTNKQIAEDCYISINTVKSNVRTAYRRVGVTNRTQAVLWGVANGLLDPPAPVTAPARQGIPREQTGPRGFRLPPEEPFSLPT